MSVLHNNPNSPNKPNNPNNPPTFSEGMGVVGRYLVSILRVTDGRGASHWREMRRKRIENAVLSSGTFASKNEVDRLVREEVGMGGEGREGKRRDGCVARLLSS